MRTIEKKTLLGAFRFNKVFAVVFESINKNVADPFACFSDYYAHYIKKHSTLLQFTQLCAGICYYFRAWLPFHSSPTKMNFSTDVHTWGKSHWLSLYSQFFLFFLLVPRVCQDLGYIEIGIHVVWKIGTADGKGPGILSPCSKILYTSQTLYCMAFKGLIAKQQGMSYSVVFRFMYFRTSIRLSFSAWKSFQVARGQRAKFIC